MRRTFFLMLLPLAVAACQPGMPNAPEQTKPVRSVIVREVKPQLLDIRIKLPVTIRARETVELRAAASGTIRGLPYSKGDTVPASKLPEPVWLEADEFVAGFPEGRKPTDEEIAMRNFRYLEGFQCFAQIDTSQMIEDLRESQANYDQAVRDLKRTEEYPQSTGAQLDQARTRRTLARATVNRMLAMVRDAYVCNPIQGVLSEKTRLQGEYVNGGELLGRVSVMDRVIADLEIPEAHRQAIKPGDSMDVVIGSLTDVAGRPLKRSGKVIRLDSVAHEFTHSFTVEIEIENADLALPAGVFGTVHVLIYSKPDALVVPMSALRLSGASKSLMVLANKEASTVTELKNVEIGHLTLEWVEIRGDKLKPGVLVVTFGAQMLADGDHVEWTEQDPYAVTASEAVQ
jgi:RND family efflux transporter MFP subunit